MTDAVDITIVASAFGVDAVRTAGHRKWAEASKRAGAAGFEVRRELFGYEADASLDQRFAWTNTERYSDHWSTTNGNGREFMYKYNSSNTVANPDGSPNGWTPDTDQFVIYTS